MTTYSHPFPTFAILDYISDVHLILSGIVHSSVSFTLYCVYSLNAWTLLYRNTEMNVPISDEKTHMTLYYNKLLNTFYISLFLQSANILFQLTSIVLHQNFQTPN